MKNLFKAEMFKFRKDKSIWIILLVIIAASTISILSGMYTSAENTFLNMAKDVMVILLALAIYSGISLFSDFHNRTIIHYIAGGQKRSCIIIAQFIRYFIGCIMIVFIYPIFCTLFSGIINGYETSFSLQFSQMLKIIFMGLPLYLSFGGLFFMVMIIFRQGVFSMGISVTISILIVVFTNKLYYGNLARETSIWRFLPSIQLQIIAADIVTTDYFISVIISVILLIITFLISKFSFEKASIK